MHGRNRDVTGTSDNTASRFSDHFCRKVEDIRADTAATPIPVVRQSWSSFRPVTEEKVRRIIMSSPVKSCSLDPIPTFLIREFVDLLTCDGYRQLVAGRLPDSHKLAIVLPSQQARFFRHSRHGEFFRSLESITPVESPKSLNELWHGSWMITSTRVCFLAISRLSDDNTRPKRSEGRYPKIDDMNPHRSDAASRIQRHFVSGTVGLLRRTAYRKDRSWVYCCSSCIYTADLSSEHRCCVSHSHCTSTLTTAIAVPQRSGRRRPISSWPIHSMRCWRRRMAECQSAAPQPRVVVSVSRSSNVSPRSRLEKNCQRLGFGRQTSRSRPFTSRAQDQCNKFPDGHADGAVRSVNGL